MLDTILREGEPTLAESFSLSARYAPKPDEFTVELSRATLTFKALKNYADIKALFKDALDYIGAVKPYRTHGADDDTLRNVYCMARTSLEPKLHERDLLEFMANEGFEFNTLTTEWDRRQVRPLVEAELAEVEREKKPDGESP